MEVPCPANLGLNWRAKFIRYHRGEHFILRAVYLLKVDIGVRGFEGGIAGTMPFSRDRTALINPERPAAGSECPILLLT